MPVFLMFYMYTLYVPQVKVDFGFEVAVKQLTYIFIIYYYYYYGPSKGTIYCHVIGLT